MVLPQSPKPLVGESRTLLRQVGRSYGQLGAWVPAGQLPPHLGPGIPTWPGSSDLSLRKILGMNHTVTKTPVPFGDNHGTAGGTSPAQPHSPDALGPTPQKAAAASSSQPCLFPYLKIHDLKK